MSGNIRRYSLDQLHKLKSLSNAKNFGQLTDADIDRMIAEDPDLHQLTDDELAEFDLVAKPNAQATPGARRE
jgi:hypothetical protein